MPPNIRQVIIAIAAAVAMAVVGVSAIAGSDRLSATFETAEFNAPETFAGRHESPLVDTDARIADREQLRRIFFQERGRPR